MAIVQHLSCLVLRQLIGGGADALLTLLDNQFTDHSRRLTAALAKANKRAWQALEIALDGDSWWGWIKGAVASADDKAVARQVQAFLETTPLPAGSADVQFRQHCLSDLKSARYSGLLTAGAPSPEQLAKVLRVWKGLADPTATLNAEWLALAEVAQAVQGAGYSHLGWLLTQRPASGMPLLVVAARFFFRREVEVDDELFRGLTFQQIDQLTAAQARGFLALTAALAQQGRILESKLEGIETGVGVIRENVLDIREELARLGPQLQVQGRRLYEDVMQLLQKGQLQSRPLRSSDSRSMQTEGERELVRSLLRQYRSLPEAQRGRATALLNEMGKLLSATGDLEEAQSAFAELVPQLPDRRSKAEVHHNAYRAALVQGRFDEALKELNLAVTDDPARFAPFPLEEYQPRRVLGSGGFGVTFLCHDQFSDSNCAVKSIALDGQERNAGSVIQEAFALNQMHHHAIIQFRCCGFADPARTRPYLVMEYFEGDTLEQRVKVNGALRLADFLPVARSIAEALEAAHAKGILHRDVKPANVLVRQDPGGWQVRLIDFGLAIKQSILDTASTQRNAGFTGSLDYASPEQLGKEGGGRIGPPADVYGFARTCCFALFGDPAPPELKGVNRALKNLLLEWLAKSPAQRLGNFVEIVARLKRIRGPRVPTNVGETEEEEGSEPLEPEEVPAPPVAPPPAPKAEAGLRLVAERGLVRGKVYPLRHGENVIGRSAEGPAEVDLEQQEAPERPFCSRRHAVIRVQGDEMLIEDLNGSNGTYLNRERLEGRKPHRLEPNDLIQIGTVQLRVRV